MAISVELGTQLEAVVGDLLATGRYNSKSEVLREGVRLVQERESRLAALDAAIAIAIGVAEADAGLLEPMDTVFDRLKVRLASRTE